MPKLTLIFHPIFILFQFIMTINQKVEQDNSRFLKIYSAIYENYCILKNRTTELKEIYYI